MIVAVPSSAPFAGLQGHRRPHPFAHVRTIRLNIPYIKRGNCVTPGKNLLKRPNIENFSASLRTRLVVFHARSAGVTPVGSNPDSFIGHKTVVALEVWPKIARVPAVFPVGTASNR